MSEEMNWDEVLRMGSSFADESDSLGVEPLCPPSLEETLRIDSHTSSVTAVQKPPPLTIPAEREGVLEDSFVISNEFDQTESKRSTESLDDSAMDDATLRLRSRRSSQGPVMNL